MRSIGWVVFVAVVAAAAAIVVRPLGALGPTMLLVLVLPPIAHALDRLGWAEIVATRAI